MTAKDNPDYAAYMAPSDREAGSQLSWTHPEECLDMPLTRDQARAGLIQLGYDEGWARVAIQACDQAEDRLDMPLTRDQARARLKDHQVTCANGIYRISHAGPAQPAYPPPRACPPGPGTAWILDVIEKVDAHLDNAAPSVYRTSPAASAELNEARALANKWRRIAGGPGCEVHEATEALLAVTGGNPRKGTHGSEDDVLSELGDTVVAGLLAIQSQTKDIKRTWAVFLAALAKADARVTAFQAQREPESGADAGQLNRLEAVAGRWRNRPESGSAEQQGNEPGGAETWAP